ncbi:hypothetical protein RRG08_026885 [Elysia crispata]|uniref:Uncharacterized protein n=1 Tax=Elysia crispata TaxID=231223 RepID=A0AAE1ADZ7_9GAST|nr:hypothetical protein RRG08_026885 [Elysia crispata]
MRRISESSQQSHRPKKRHMKQHGSEKSDLCKSIFSSESVKRSSLSTNTGQRQLLMRRYSSSSVSSNASSISSSSLCYQRKSRKEKRCVQDYGECHKMSFQRRSTSSSSSSLSSPDKRSIHKQMSKESRSSRKKSNRHRGRKRQRSSCSISSNSPEHSNKRFCFLALHSSDTCNSKRHLSTPKSSEPSKNRRGSVDSHSSQPKGNRRCFISSNSPEPENGGHVHLNSSRVNNEGPYSMSSRFPRQYENEHNSAPLRSSEKCKSRQRSDSSSSLESRSYRQSSNSSSFFESPCSTQRSYISDNHRRHSVSSSSPEPNKNKRYVISNSAESSSKRQGSSFPEPRSNRQQSVCSSSPKPANIRHCSVSSCSPEPCRKRKVSISSGLAVPSINGVGRVSSKSKPLKSCKSRHRSVYKSSQKHSIDTSLSPSFRSSNEGSVKSDCINRKRSPKGSSAGGNLRRNSSPARNNKTKRGARSKYSPEISDVLKSGRRQMSPTMNLKFPDCDCGQDLNFNDQDKKCDSSNGDFFTPVKDLRNKLNVSRQHSKLNRRFSTPSSGFKTSSSHHFDRAVSYTISRDHRKASSENVKSDPLRPVNKGDRDLNPGDVYQTPKRSSFVDLLNNNSKTPRTPDQYLASRSLSFSTLNETWATELLTRSQSYRYSFIDSHCHLDFLYSRMGVPFNTQYNEFMERHAHSYPVNYEGCVAVFCNPRTFNLHRPQDQILNLVSEESGVWLALGCHPKSATEFGISHEEGLRKMLSHPKVVALGEIGLDYSGRFRLNADVQKKVLITQLKLAIELDLPLVIHCRDADDDCLEILTQYVPRRHKIHLHCFTRDTATAQRWMDAFPNLFLGFTPVITYKSAWEPALTSKHIPMDRLLLETDAPYFVPGHVKNPTVKLSHPGFALFTAEKIAELRGIPVDDVLKACRKNTSRMYGI